MAPKENNGFGIYNIPSDFVILAVRSSRTNLYAKYSQRLYLKGRVSNVTLYHSEKQ